MLAFVMIAYRGSALSAEFDTRSNSCPSIVWTVIHNIVFGSRRNAHFLLKKKEDFLS
jgi:hypothetical protein